jgi:ribosomal protein S18 acetylase RimI-like enzyme
MEERTTGPDIRVAFREIRLPRPMLVEYPRTRDYLLEDWQRNGCFLVAEQDGRVLGYLDLQLARWNQVGEILNLVVDRPYRRTGIGSSLVERGIAWSRSLGLRAIMTVVQTKNYPAISLGHQYGFAFCGYNDQYYVSGDIALFFCLNLK